MKAFLPVLALCGAILSIPAFSNEVCESLKIELAQMKYADLETVRDLYRKHGSVLEKMVLEANVAMAVIRVAVSSNPEISKMARELKADTRLGKDTKRATQILGAKVMRILPRFLNQNSFAELSGHGDGKLVPVYDRKGTAEAMEKGLLSNMGYYSSSLRLVNAGTLSLKNENSREVNFGIVINQEYPVGSIHALDDRLPWEVAVYAEGEANSFPETEAAIWLRTQPMILDLGDNSMRYFESRDASFVDRALDFLDSEKNVIVMASVKSRYLQHKWYVEKLVEKCPK